MKKSSPKKRPWRLTSLWSGKLPISDRLSQTALALVMGGALGNLIDRAMHGYVIDFVDVYWKSHHWPAFNVADSCITVGVTLLLLDILKSPAEAPKRPFAAEQREQAQ